MMQPGIQSSTDIIGGDISDISENDSSSDQIDNQSGSLSSLNSVPYIYISIEDGNGCVSSTRRVARLVRNVEQS